MLTEVWKDKKTKEIMKDLLFNIKANKRPK